ncbi:MAG: hypothetical protein QM713_11185 [Arachnia sp.]
MPERFSAGLTPLPTAARVTRQRGALRWRIGSTVVSALILFAVVWFLGRDWPRAWTYTVIGLWVVSSVFWLVVSSVGLKRAKRDLARIHEGVAFHFDADGVEFVNPGAGRVPWEDVSSLRLVGRFGGAGPAVAVFAQGAEVARVPLSFLDASPAVIDSAARAYSLGRVHLDVSALDRVL